MIPQTIVGFFFFLLLVAPGVRYELLREQRRPAINETAFREAARVALYSFGFSFSACAIIALLRIKFRTALFDPAAYNHDNKTYLNTFYTAMIWTVVIEVLIAFALVYILDLIFATKLQLRLLNCLPKPIQRAMSPAIQKHGLWWELFENKFWRKDGKVPLLRIRLSGGSRIAGFLAGYTTYDKLENAEIAITKGEGEGTQMLMLDRTDSDENDATLGKQAKPIPEDVVWVRGEDISYIKVQYADRASSSDVGKKVLTACVDIVEVPSAQWGWSKQNPRTWYVVGLFIVGSLLLMLRGNHVGHVEDWFLIGFAVLVLAVIIRDIWGRHRGWIR